MNDRLHFLKFRWTLTHKRRRSTVPVFVLINPRIFLLARVFTQKLPNGTKRHFLTWARFENTCRRKKSLPRAGLSIRGRGAPYQRKAAALPSPPFRSSFPPSLLPSLPCFPVLASPAFPLPLSLEAGPLKSS